MATLSIATKMLKNDAIKENYKIAETTVNTIERQNIRLQKLIDQVLNNSLGYQQISLQKETVIASKYMNTILDDFVLSIDNKEVSLTRNISASEQKITVDKFYITTALFNILENGVKYSNEKIEINCTTEIKEGLLISITDNGIGISEKHQKLIFDEFFRIGNKEIHNVKGLGLGLYYTNQIIKAHKGEIKVTKNEKGQTKFIINIPLNL